MLPVHKLSESTQLQTLNATKLKAVSNQEPAHRQALWTSCSVNQMACCHRCSIEFNAEANRVECAEKDRKSNWSATKKIECYIDALMASPTDAELEAQCTADGKACINQWREAKYKTCEEVCVDIDSEAGDYHLVDGYSESPQHIATALHMGTDAHFMWTSTSQRSH